MAIVILQFIIIYKARKRASRLECNSIVSHSKWVKYIIIGDIYIFLRKRLCFKLVQIFDCKSHKQICFFPMRAFKCFHQFSR